MQTVNVLTDETLKETLEHFAEAANNYDRDFPDPVSRAHLAVEKVPTGFPALDHALDGGLALGSLTVLRGCASSGKTTFATQLAKHLIAQGYYVTYYGCEDSYVTLRTKMVTQELFQLSGCDPSSTPSTSDQLNPKIYNEFPPELWAGIKTCHTELATVLKREAPECCGSNFLYIDCNTLSSADIVHYSQALRNATSKAPIVIVDYLQRLNSPLANYTGSGADKASIDANINMLQNLAHDMSTIVIVLGSVAKTAFKAPLADDADEGSNRIMHAADNLFVLSPSEAKSKKSKESSEVTPDTRDMQVYVSKQRGGRTKYTVPLLYYPSADFFYCKDMPTGDDRIVHKRYNDLTALDLVEDEVFDDAELELLGFVPDETEDDFKSGEETTA